MEPTITLDTLNSIPSPQADPINWAKAIDAHLSFFGLAGFINNGHCENENENRQSPPVSAPTSGPTNAASSSCRPGGADDDDLQVRHHRHRQRRHHAFHIIRASLGKNEWARILLLPVAARLWGNVDNLKEDDVRLLDPQVLYDLVVFLFVPHKKRELIRLLEHGILNDGPATGGGVGGGGSVEAFLHRMKCRSERLTRLRPEAAVPDKVMAALLARALMPRRDDRYLMNLATGTSTRMMPNNLTLEQIRTEWELSERRGRAGIHYDDDNTTTWPGSSTINTAADIDKGSFAQQLRPMDMMMDGGHGGWKNSSSYVYRDSWSGPAGHPESSPLPPWGDPSSPSHSHSGWTQNGEKNHSNLSPQPRPNRHPQDQTWGGGTAWDPSGSPGIDTKTSDPGSPFPGWGGPSKNDFNSPSDWGRGNNDPAWATTGSPPSPPLAPQWGDGNRDPFERNSTERRPKKWTTPKMQWVPPAAAAAAPVSQRWGNSPESSPAPLRQSSTRSGWGGDWGGGGRGSPTPSGHGKKASSVAGGGWGSWGEPARGHSGGKETQTWGGWKNT